MFEQHLQFIAEQLADALQRSVIIDDAALRPLAVTPQRGLVDQSRVEAVLQRHTSQRLRRLMDEYGVFQAREPVSIPANDALATLPRLCLPLVQRDQLLGFLWLIDEPALTAEQIERARAAAVQARELLHRRAVRQAEEFDTSRDLIDALLRPAESGRHVAARQLTEDRTLTGSPPYALAVVRHLAEESASALPASALPASVQGDLRRAAGDLRLRAAPGAFVMASPSDHELVAVTTRDRIGLLRGALSAVPGPLLAMGTCSHAEKLEALHADLDNARYAAEIAAHVAEFDQVADWAELGIYAAFQYMKRDDAAPGRILPGISALRTDHGGMYEATVRAYLDSGANAQKTAAVLHIHRTTLYWRLARAAEMLSVDLSRGEDRLRLHLALKLADLTRTKAGRTGPPLPSRA